MSLTIADFVEVLEDECQSLENERCLRTDHTDMFGLGVKYAVARILAKMGALESVNEQFEGRVEE